MRSSKNGRLISRRSVEHVANQAHAMTDNEFRAATALITGAANGIGFATAKRLASRGMRVARHCLRRAFGRFGGLLALCRAMRFGSREQGLFARLVVPIQNPS